MKRRPLAIYIISIGYLIQPVIFLLNYFYFSEVPFQDLSTWTSLLTPYKLSFVIFPPIVAFGIWRIRVWGWYLALAHLFYIIGNNTLAYLVGSRSPPWMLFLQMILTLVVLVVFVREAVRAPYFNPRVRWWEAKPRYAITLNVELENERLNVKGETYNISVGGLFMISEADIQIDEVFKARLSRNGAEPVECEGRVVWINPAGQDPPQGFGFVFTEVGKAAMSEICRYIKDQKRVMKDKARSREP